MKKSLIMAVIALMIAILIEMCLLIYLALTHSWLVIPIAIIWLFSMNTVVVLAPYVDSM